MNATPPTFADARRLLISLVALAILGATGCGGSSGSAPPVAAPPAIEDEQGLAIIGLTDDAGDFVSYRVEVVSINLQRANGVSVETLPESTMVDFAQYVEATEFVTAASVPNGLYTGMSLVLDYTDAKIIVEDADGNDAAAVVVDDGGNAVTRKELRVDFSDRDQFRVAPGIPAHVTLDFDLSASHKIDLAAVPIEAALGGVLVADTLLEEPKPHRARGLLIDVDLTATEFDLAIRPFFRATGDFGSLTVASNAATTFEIDGVSYPADDGLVALADKPRGTGIVVFGVLDRDSRAFIAEHVLAGSSVPFGDADIAAGTVVARSGNTLTLRGVTLVRADMSVIYNNLLSVEVGDNTNVTQQGASLIAIGVDDISVGQRITAHGTLSDNTMLDATAGLTRVRYSDLAGIALQTSPLVMDLSTINRRRVGQFDFTGTGAGSDADPDNYEVNSGTLTLAGIEPGSPTRIRGLVAPFTSAPEDFFAKTIADVSALPARLLLNWLEPGDSAAFLAIDATAIVVDLDADLIGRLHYFIKAGIAQDLLDSGSTLTILPRANGRGVFTLRQNNRQQVFFDFAGFSEELARRLDGTTAVTRVSGHGDVADANQFTPTRLLVMLE